MIISYKSHQNVTENVHVRSTLDYKENIRRMGT